MPKKEKQTEARKDAENNRFTEALASVLSVSRAEMKEKLAQAKPEKPSPHTKYTYAPEEDRS